MDLYTRQSSISETADPGVRAQRIDSELDAISNGFKALEQRISKALEDDGTLKAGAVNPKSIGRDISLSPAAGEEWRPDTVYPANSLVYRDMATFYCIKKHKSSADFDEDAANWEIIIDFRPMVAKLQALAGSPHVVRVSKNMDALMALAEMAPRLLEISKNLSRLLEIADKLPLLGQFVSEKGEPVLKTVYENLVLLRGISENEDDIQKVAMARDEIAKVARVVMPLGEVANALHDVRDAVKFMRQIQNTAKAANTSQTG